jgi:SpoVK/Ycf46/Vps4 family AAA+-type ATPase
MTLIAGDVKVITTTNRIENLDPALIRPGRIDRKILFENPHQNTRNKIFTIHGRKCKPSFRGVGQFEGSPSQSVDLGNWHSCEE